MALPYPEQCYPAMRTLDLIVHIGTKLNRSHLLVGKESIPIPCLGRTERDVQGLHEGPSEHRMRGRKCKWIVIAIAKTSDATMTGSFRRLIRSEIGPAKPPASNDRTRLITDPTRISVAAAD